MTVKTGEEPWVIFMPDFGLIKVRGRDFRLETNPRKMSMWVSQAAAENALSMLLPENPVKRMLVVHGQAVTQSEGFRRQAAWEAFQKLFNVYQTSMTDKEKEILYEQDPGTADR